MTPVPILVFVRHGETDWNVEGRLQGQRDIPLNAKGRGQAKRNGETIRELIPEAVGFDFISSPLSRTRETMEILRAAMDLDPTAYEVDTRLLEITFGELEGFTYRDIEEREPGWSRARHADKWNYCRPAARATTCSPSASSAGSRRWSGRPWSVAHGGVGRVLRAHLLGLDRLATVSEDFPQDRIFLWRDGTGEWL